MGSSIVKAEGQEGRNNQVAVVMARRGWMAEVLRMHRHCMLSTFYKRPIRLKKAYYPGSTIPWNRVSPPHVNLQVANFQNNNVPSPVQSRSHYKGYTVTHMHPLQADVLFVYFTVQYWVKYCNTVSIFQGQDALKQA